jgi:hypothetical protein
LTTDLTNFGNVVGSLTKGTNDPSGSGTQTTPPLTGVGIGAAADHTQKPDPKDLLTNDPTKNQP